MILPKKNPDTVIVTIEIPMGSRNKYEYDKEKKIIKSDRMLFSALHYPLGGPRRSRQDDNGSQAKI